MKKVIFASLLCAGAIIACFISTVHPEIESPSEAGEAMDWWTMARTFPEGRFYTEKYTEALAFMRQTAQKRDERSNEWESIGPKNFGGRTLCIAVNPLDTAVIWAGSAAGGLWKSTSGGRGANAWQRVETGFPVLGVAAIAIDPQHPQVMYIGTGEVYNWENSMPNVAIRTTRGTYGIGILKSTDGGQTWFKSLDWSYGNLRGVQDIKINPKRPATIFAATTEGLLRSRDAGASWQTVNNLKMAVDIEINPIDTNKVYVTHGSLDDQSVSGIYRSINGGNTFQKLSNGLPVSYSGKTMLGMNTSNPEVLFASMADAFQQIGLYKTVDGGEHWALMSSNNTCSSQGWYSHDVTVYPFDTTTILWAGIDVWKSYDGGQYISQKTYWNYWYFGAVPAGNPEGPFNYVHADVHRLYWLPNNPNVVYAATDGGIFISYNGGETWAGRNGGYQTQQFYANLSNSPTNPNWCIGGMQDNATAIYKGSTDWIRVLGADGACTAVNPLNEQLVFGSAQYLNISRSTDGGSSWTGINGSTMSSEKACFNGPFEIAPNHPEVMYAGAQRLYRSVNSGQAWTKYTNNFVGGGDIILSIAVHPSNPGIVYCSTAPYTTTEARVFKVTNGGATSTQLTGLPNRICMDIAINPVNPSIIYTVFSGFNTRHIWKSIDDGLSWTAIDQSIPDVPASSLLIDLQFPDHLYLGNDLGVWFSPDAGASWQWYSENAPNAMPVMHLSVSADRHLRVATHGLGVWQTYLETPVENKEIWTLNTGALFPNPVSNQLQWDFYLPNETTISYQVLDVTGRRMLGSSAKNFTAGKQQEVISVLGWPSGTYVLVAEYKTAVGATRRVSQKFIVQ
ncbi:MAG: T9SS type A sorting domain-containing protein [Bacteroidota bacterium]